MAEHRRRIVPREVQAGLLSEDDPPLELDLDVTQEWVPEESTETWTDWEQVDVKVDEDPTYTAEYDYRRASIFHVPLKAMHPHRKKTVTWERKLIRRWVDPKLGPMAKVVDTEHRMDRY